MGQDAYYKRSTPIAVQVIVSTLSDLLNHSVRLQLGVVTVGNLAS